MTRQKDEKGSFRIGLWSLSALLGMGAGLSVLGLILARRRGDENALLWLGLLAVSLWFGTLLCLALKVSRIVEARKRRNIDIRPGRIRTDAEYIAEYSGRDRGTAIALALFFGILTAFLALRSTTGAVLSGAVFCWSAWYVMQVTSTRVHFTRERIIARLPWFREISEPYGSVLRLHSRPGTVDLQFSDGRSLKLHSGLGDPDVILAYLDAHCPPSVVAGGELR